MDDREIMNGDDELMQEETRDAWKIENDQTADWAVEKIKEANAELDRWTRYYNGLIESVKQKTKSTVDFMTARLEEYFQKVPHKQTATMEKYPLPSGDLIMKKSKQVFDHDDATLLAWLKENAMTEFVKVTEKPDWAGIKKRLTISADGTVVDSESALVCDVVTVKTDNGGFEVRI